MRWLRNVQAAWQVVTAAPVRAVLLAMPVAVCAALALATLALDQGMTAKAQEAAKSFGTDNIVVRPDTKVIAGKPGGKSGLTESDVDALRINLKGAKAVEGTYDKKAVPVSYGSKNGTYHVFGVRPGWAEVRQFGAARGQFISDDDVDAKAKVCLLGQTVVNDLFGKQDPIGAEIVVNQVSFKVKGVLVSKGDSGGQEGDRDARLVIPFSTFPAHLYKRIHLDQIVVQTKDSSAETLHDVGDQIKTILRKEHKITPGQEDDFKVKLPDKIAEQSRELDRGIFFLLLGLAGIGAVVAALVIGLVIQQSVRARQGEIGMRRALGALPSDILQQVAAEGITVSLLGGIVGVILGLGAARGLAAAQGLKLEINGLVLAIPLLLILVTALAGLWPARAAARLDPAVALRLRN